MHENYYKNIGLSKYGIQNSYYNVAIKKKVFTAHTQTRFSKIFEMYRKMCIYIPPGQIQYTKSQNYINTFYII